VKPVDRLINFLKPNVPSPVNPIALKKRTVIDSPTSDSESDEEETADNFNINFNDFVPVNPQPVGFEDDPVHGDPNQFLNVDKNNDEQNLDDEDDAVEPEDQDDGDDDDTVTTMAASCAPPNFRGTNGEDGPRWFESMKWFLQTQ
jgi:hypothetical protein